MVGKQRRFIVDAQTGEVLNHRHPWAAHVIGGLSWNNGQFNDWQFNGQRQLAKKAFMTEPAQAAAQAL